MNRILSAAVISAGIGLGSLLTLSSTASAQTPSTGVATATTSCVVGSPPTDPAQTDSATASVIPSTSSAAASTVAAIPADTTGGLAFTGTNVGLLGAIGGSLTLAGGVLLAVTRRRRPGSDLA